MVRERGGGELNGFQASNTGYGPSTKKSVRVREIKGKELRRRSLNSHMHKINKEHASKEVRPF